MAVSYDVVAIGNAIIDILIQADEAFLIEHGITKGAMTLIDEERALYLTALAAEAVLEAGGSAANTATGVASFGGRAAFIGKVADDSLGESYGVAFSAAGVAFDCAPRPGPPGTARSVIVITPDGQRSMNTYLGASTLLEPEDLDADLIRSGNLLFLEGYLFDRPQAKATFVAAAEIAKTADRRVCLTLSDVFCVERHREAFKHLVAGHVDVLFANESEILSLYETPSLEAALAQARAACPLVVVTRSAEGALIAAADQQIEIAAEPTKVIDTTGAGDLFAGGFLFGLAQGRDLATCGRLGALAAAEVISHIGPRPAVSLATLAAARGL